MNENDPNSNLQKSPILSPETLAKKEETTLASVAPEPQTDAVSSGSKSKMILIGSCAALLLIGSVSVALLVHSGAFSKDKKPEKEETVITLTSETKKETKEETTKEETQEKTDTSATSTDATTAASNNHKSVTELSQITDDQIRIMDETARKLIRTDSNSIGGGMPDEVDIDGMYHLGMMRQIINYENAMYGECDQIEMVYQVQVTDKTGTEPVKRQFFWMVGFDAVYQDGTIDPTKIEFMFGTMCFDNWTMHGAVSVNNLVREAELNWPLYEKEIDKSLIQSFEGAVVDEVPVIRSLSQLTDAMAEEIQKGSQEFMHYGFHYSSGAQYDSIKIENIEFAGFALASAPNHNINCIYPIYKMDIADLNQTPPEKKSIYWFLGFKGTYEGGQVQTGLLYQSSYPDRISDFMDLTSIDKLREYIQAEEALGWNYEDNLEKELYTVPVKSNSTFETTGASTEETTDNT